MGLQAALVIPSVLVAGGVADPVGSAPFQDITTTIDSAGNFSLSQAQLVDLYGNDLADGTYALKLRAKDELGNFSQEMRVTFTFDLTAPTQDITSLIDGITWVDGEVLAGSVSDGTGTGVNQVAYRYWQTGSSGESLGDQTVTVSQTGTFNQALGEIKNLAAGVYDFSVTSSDLAGNQQSQAFRFLKSDDSPIEDQDLYVLESGEVAGQDGGTRANAPAGETGNYGYFGPTSSGGYGWGNYSTGANSTLNWQPSGFSGFPGGTNLPYIGTGYDLEYTDAVKKIVDYGTGAISRHPLTISKKAALQNRQEVLRAIADRLNRISKADNDSLNDQAFFDQMQGVMENLFVTAYNPTDVGEDSPLNGLLESKAGGAGYVLAQDLVKDSTAVSVQVFQATLLAAFNEVLYGQAISTTPEAHSTLLKAALELGQTYAKLAPSRETGTVLASDADFGFLDLLWRAQQPRASGRLPGKDVIKAQLQNGVEALGRLLNGVSDPISTLKFLNNLLNAAANSVALNEPRLASSGGGFNPRGDIRSAQFIRELMKFGFEVAKVNPIVTTTGEMVISEFLNTLWRGGDDRKGQGGLNQFFEGAKSGSDRVKLLEFGDRLVDAAQLLQDSGLQTEKKDARFLSQLLNLGSSYVALNPIAAAGDQPLNFFLSTAYQLSNTRLTAQQLDSFLQSVTNPDVVLFANSDRLKTLNKITDSSLQDVKRSNEFISKTMGVALTEKAISLFNIRDYKGIKNQTNPLALVGIDRFIDIVEKVEAVYKNDTPQQIITRLRRLYYPGNSGLDLLAGIKNQQAFALLPHAPNYLQGSASDVFPPERRIDKAYLNEVDKSAYAILTAKANENGIEDNPSPYIVIPGRNEMIDIGHMLLTLDALLHPGSNAPYSDPYYNVPTIDPASWVADVSIGSVWLTLKQNGTSQEGTPINLKLSSSIPTKEEIDEYYKASAPEADILGDVDGFGLFDRFNSPDRKDQRLSTHLKEYYLQTGNDIKFSIRSRWKTFAAKFQATPIEATFDADELTAPVKQAWVDRINRLNNLFGDGGIAATIAPVLRNPNWNWTYTKAMFDRFVEYVQEQLKNERKP